MSVDTNVADTPSRASLLLQHGCQLTPMFADTPSRASLLLQQQWVAPGISALLYIRNSIYSRFVCPEACSPCPTPGRPGRSSRLAGGGCRATASHERPTCTLLLNPGFRCAPFLKAAVHAHCVTDFPADHHPGDLATQRPRRRLECGVRRSAGADFRCGAPD
ncbi:hypothetical protein D3C87_1713580 [compost metagenome]